MADQLDTDVDDNIDFQVSMVTRAARILLFFTCVAILIGILAAGLNYAPQISGIASLKANTEFVQHEIAGLRQQRQELSDSIAQSKRELSALPTGIGRSLQLATALDRAAAQSNKDREIRAIVADYAAATLAGIPSSSSADQAVRQTIFLTHDASSEAFRVSQRFSELYYDHDGEPAEIADGLVGLSSDPRFYQSAKAALVYAEFMKFEGGDWDSMEAALAYKTLDPSGSLAIAQKFNVVDPLIWLGNFQRRTGHIAEALKTFNEAVAMLKGHADDSPLAYDVYHGRGTVLLSEALSSSQISYPKLRSAWDSLILAERARRLQGQTQAMINETRENEGLVLLAQGKLAEAKTLSRSISDVSDSAWNTVVMCFAEEGLSDAQTFSSCQKVMKTFKRSQFHEKELRRLLPLPFRAKLGKLLEQAGSGAGA